MHEGGALTWREVVDKYHSALIDELSVRLDSAVRDAVDRAVAAEHSQAVARIERACDDARRSRVESLNQVLRRLRTTGQEHILELLAEGCASYAEKVVVLVFESNQARCAARAGIENGLRAFETDSASAIVAAIDSRDPVVALATEAEISTVLAEVFGPAPDRKAYLFPVVARHSVMAMLIASDVTSEINHATNGAAPQSAPIELLCEAAGMRLEAFGTPDAGGFVPFAPGVTAIENTRPRAWDELTADDQKLHLQAQRTARVRVAEIRLYHENELRSGVAGGDIYGALRDVIDSARNRFLQTFPAKSPTMVDYLHLEILHTLAHDDDRLLGPNYPGPMV